MPSEGGTVPSAEGIVPSAEGIAPSAEGIAPSAEGIAPSAEGIAPSAEVVTATAATIPVAGASPAAADTLDFAPVVGDLFERSLGINFEERDPAMPGIDSVAVFEVAPPPGQPRAWIAHTVGMRDFAAGQAHVVAVYVQLGADTVSEAARVTLREDPTSEEMAFAPDYLYPGGVRTAAIEPTALWLAVEGGAGAHSGVYHLLRFDGSTLAPVLSTFSPSPGAGLERDLDGDGTGEVLINQTEPYVFCYACGVRIPAWGVRRWTGEAMEPLAVVPLPDESSDDARALNHELMVLAAHDLWSAVESELPRAEALIGEDPSGTLAWNVRLLRLNAEARRAQVENPSPYPLLDHVFYGDVAGAEAILRAYLPQEIFALDSPLIAGTVAEGWEESLATWIERSATGWLEADPDLPAASFLRAWASFLVGKREVALLDLETAARSGDPFYQANLDFLRGGGVASARLSVDGSVTAYSGPGLSYPAAGELQPGAAFTVTGRFGEGADRWWQIAFPSQVGGRAWVPSASAAVRVENGENAPPARPPALVGDVAERGRLFFSYPDAGGMGAIYSMDAVAEAEPTLVLAEARQPALHPQGTLLAFASQRPDMLGLGGLDLLTGERLRYSFNLEDSLPRWNASGDKLLFSSTREGDRRPRVYWLWADENGNAQALRSGQDADWNAAGSIVSKGCNETGAACGLWLMQGDGSDATPLTDNPSDSRPRWSPDGSSVVFMSEQRDGNWEIYRIDAAGTTLERLTDEPALDGLPVFSPDGQNIAFVSNRDGVWSLWVMPAVGGPPAALHVFGLDFPDWLDHSLDWAR